MVGLIDRVWSGVGTFGTVEAGEAGIVSGETAMVAVVVLSSGWGCGAWNAGKVCARRWS